MEWTIESLTDYLIKLFVTKDIVDSIIKKVDKISHSLLPEEFLAIGVEKNGNDIHVMMKIFDEDKPKCWVEDNQYKFNSRYLDTIVIRGKR